MTIVDRVKLRRGTVKDTKGRPTRINAEKERKLADGLRTMEKYGFGLSSKETTEVVTKFIKHNKIKTDFKNDTPGYDWFAGFRKRNNLSLKKPQAVEMSRKAACDPFIIKDYFDTLESCINELGLNYSPEKIWNLDESSFSKDPEKTKIVGARGFASTRTIASAGKDNVTVLFAANAFGEKLPPLIIFRGKNVWDQWMSEKAYKGTTYAATKNGWIESKVFEKYMLHTVLPLISKEGPSLLIYDGHSTHIQLKILENAAKMGVTIIKLPSHASHLLQPLDLAVFKSMKDKWDAKIVSWQRLNVGTKLQKDTFSQILGEVWQELDPKVIRNGFKKGGVYPLNKNVIPDEKFNPESVNRLHSAKIQQTKKNVPALSSICLKVVNIVNINAPEDEISNDKAPNTKRLILKPCEIFVPGTSVGTSKIHVIEDRHIENGPSFESLLLSTIKRPEIAMKVKKKKAARGCDVITYEYFLNKLRAEEKEKKKKEDDKIMKQAQKAAKKLSKKKTKSCSKAKKRPKKIKDLSETSSDEDDPILSDDSHLDWNTYCENIHQNDQKNSDEEQMPVHTEPITERKMIDNNIYEPNLHRRYPKVDDWLLVKFATKRTVKHFIGNVISMVAERPNIKFVRIIKNSKIQSFHYPLVEDISEVKHYSDIVMFLEKPVITRRGHIIFKEDLNTFNVQ